MLKTLNEVDPAGLHAFLAEDETHLGPAGEQRVEAELIARRIERRERDGKLIGSRELATIVREVYAREPSTKVTRRDAGAIGKRFCAKRLFVLLQAAIAAEARRLTHEVWSKDPNELIDEVRGLVRALAAGTYWEEERDEPHGVAMKAAWPGGGSGRFSLSRDPDRSLTEWRKRAYDPY